MHFHIARAAFKAKFVSPDGSFVCPVGETFGSWGLKARDELTEFIDFEDIRRWITTCEKNHRGCSPSVFNPAVLPRNSKRQLDFRLVDVHSMCLVYALRHCRYIALSYVWGSRGNRLLLNSNNEEELLKPGSLRLPENEVRLPTTIRDAMTAVRGLGETYLWVDSLCLVQDDSDELQECVAIMDLFYEMALFTIVAGSGKDAWSGLPGVRPTPRRTNRLVRDIVPGLRMTTVMGMETILRDATYSTRAWT